MVWPFTEKILVSWKSLCGIVVLLWIIAKSTPYEDFDAIVYILMRGKFFLDNFVKLWDDNFRICFMFVVHY